MYTRFLLPLASLLLTAASLGAAQPNIILIMSDDMGFSDLGCYGGEIQTPNLDRLAKGGVRLSQFYNAGRCCPTRASLLTGLYPHQHRYWENSIALDGRTPTWMKRLRDA
ncbi:MAG: sulfatase-like hydrolase/transferase, partial [Verrucomicrobia bacterium]|nr:sulfatase-like hydrolase/transferase [Verrucomicrobiota bacterium]